ncbi:uncharacterized protein LOC130918962 isoform X2 [Corythoichthys intestinalis]|uniref:uncharacterized protein LOC130918962 isoform X2 n=1 Tax=Corythoichthys intestinalis TaxID=161448 RepID=UPI0025A5BE3A|nr:uncharacterized protein LOC130918962 isoform X2 [Corythoichthys intestinalis]
MKAQRNLAQAGRRGGRGHYEMDSKQHKPLKIIALSAFLLAQMDCAAPMIHSLKNIVTASFQIPNFPEYLSTGYVDGIQILQYDSKSRKLVAKQEWMKKIIAEDPRYWERQTEINIDNQQANNVSIQILQERFNKTGGLHMIQWMSGCQWDDETDQVDGWTHYAYDGEDFIWFDLKGMRWIAVHPRAVITKNKWDREEGYNEFLKFYATEDCPSYLKKYLSFGRDVLRRTALFVGRAPTGVPAAEDGGMAGHLPRYRFLPKGGRPLLEEGWRAARRERGDERDPSQPRRDLPDQRSPRNGGRARSLRVRLPAGRCAGGRRHPAVPRQGVEQRAHRRHRQSAYLEERRQAVPKHLINMEAGMSAESDSVHGGSTSPPKMERTVAEGEMTEPALPGCDQPSSAEAPLPQREETLVAGDRPPSDETQEAAPSAQQEENHPTVQSSADKAPSSPKSSHSKTPPRRRLHDKAPSSPQSSHSKMPPLRRLSQAKASSRPKSPQSRKPPRRRLSLDGIRSQPDWDSMDLDSKVNQSLDVLKFMSSLPPLYLSHPTGARGRWQQTNQPPLEFSRGKAKALQLWNYTVLSFYGGSHVCDTNMMCTGSRL